MAIKLRRGVLADFDKAKMVEGEVAITKEGGMYYCYMAGQVEKVMNERDLAAFLSVSQEQFDMLIQLLESTGEFEEFAELFITDTLNNYTVTVLNPLKTEMEGLLAEARALVGSALRFVATVTFANLPTLSESLLGDMYSVSDSFTTDNRFVDGSGKKVEAGTNVAVVDVDGVYLFDVLATTTDLTPITNPTFTESTNFETINSQESLPTLFGKIKKWFGQITQNKNDIVQLNSNLMRIRLTLAVSSYYPSGTYTYLNGIVGIKIAGTLAQSITAGVAYTIATGSTIPAQYRPNTGILKFVSFASAGNLLRLSISTTGEITITSNIALSEGAAININEAFMAVI